MTSLLDRSQQILREEGPLKLLGKGLRYAGNELLESSKRKQKRRVVEHYENDPKYLNVGGGAFVRENWRVLDYHTTWYDYDEVFIDFNTDLEETKKWPIADDSYDLVYTSHTLEHLSPEAVSHTISEAKRILKPSGGIRISVPDMELVLAHYDAGDLRWFTDVWREKYSHGGYEAEDKCPPGYELEFYLLVFFASYLVIEEYEATDFEGIRQDRKEMDDAAFLSKYSSMIRDEWQSEKPWLHRNWFRYKKLRDSLAEAGFEDIEQSVCRQSRFPELCMEAFDNHAWMSLYVEATAPE